MRVHDTFNGFVTPARSAPRGAWSSRATCAPRERTDPVPHPVECDDDRCRVLVNALRREIDRLRAGVDRTTDGDRSNAWRRAPDSPVPLDTWQRAMSYAVRPLSEPNERDPLPEEPAPRFVVQRQIVLPIGTTVDLVV